MYRTFPKHLKNFKEGQNVLEFLRNIKNNDEIVRVLRVYVKHVRTRQGTKYAQWTMLKMITAGLRAIVVDLLKKSTTFWQQRVKPELFIEGLIFLTVCLTCKIEYIFRTSAKTAKTVGSTASA